jgi:hypothetical protein
MRQKISPKDRVRLLETHYGHESGWYVERFGRPVAILSCPVFCDQYWTRFTVTPATVDPEEIASLGSDLGWARPELVYRNIEVTGFEAHFLARLAEPGTVMLYGIPQIPGVSLVDYIVVRLRKVKQKLLGLGRTKNHRW